MVARKFQMLGYLGFMRLTSKAIGKAGMIFQGNMIGMNKVQRISPLA